MANLGNYIVHSLVPIILISLGAFCIGFGSLKVGIEPSFRWTVSRLNNKAQAVTCQSLGFGNSIEVLHETIYEQRNFAVLNILPFLGSDGKVWLQWRGFRGKKNIYAVIKAWPSWIFRDSRKSIPFGKQSQGSLDSLNAGDRPTMIHNGRKNPENLKPLWVEIGGFKTRYINQYPRTLAVNESFRAFLGSVSRNPHRNGLTVHFLDLNDKSSEGFNGRASSDYVNDDERPVADDCLDSYLAAVHLWFLGIGTVLFLAGVYVFWRNSGCGLTGWRWLTGIPRLDKAISYVLMFIGLALLLGAQQAVEESQKYKPCSHSRAFLGGLVQGECSSAPLPFRPPLSRSYTLRQPADFTNSPYRFGVNILPDEDFRDRFSPYNGIDQIRASFVAPDTSSLKFGLKFQFLAIMPFTEIVYAVSSRIEVFHSWCSANGGAPEATGVAPRCPTPSKGSNTLEPQVVTPSGKLALLSRSIIVSRRFAWVVLRASDASFKYPTNFVAWD